ncbi:MAG: hypothetical protein O7E52_18085 [Candidatus Poribacteria bacterium]|nr:hypothetical protein [Candidatus Poribacteria bacterium]
MSAADDDLKVLAVLYEKFKNPLCALHAIKTSLEHDLPIPQWAQDYLLHSVNLLLAIPLGLGQPPSRKTHAAIADALGLSKPGVQITNQFHNLLRNIEITRAVRRQRKEESHPRMQTTINKNVGEIFGLEDGVVRKIHEEFSPLIEKLDK